MGCLLWLLWVRKHFAGHEETGQNVLGDVNEGVICVSVCVGRAGCVLYGCVGSVMGPPEALQRPHGSVRPAEGPAALLLW